MRIGFHLTPFWSPTDRPPAQIMALADMVGTITDASGHAPRGWLGPALTETFNTPNLLTEVGVEYILDWCNDDQPYPVNVSSGRMIVVPYSIELNDVSIFAGKSMPPQGLLSDRGRPV
jgi:hypothetical protein